MECQILFSGKNKKNIMNLSSAELSQRVVKVNYFFLTFLYHPANFVCGDGVGILFSRPCVRPPNILKTQ